MFIKSFISKFLILGLIVFCFVFVGNVYANDNFLVVAKVNNDVITNYDLGKRYDFVTKTSGIKYNTWSYKKKLKLQVLNKLIEERLYFQKADKLGIEIDDKEINKQIEKMELSRGMYMGETKDYFKRIGVSYDDYKKQLESQLVFRGIVEKDIKPAISVTNSEVEEYIESISNNNKKDKMDKYVDTEYLLSEIYIPSKQRTKVSQEYSLASKIYDELYEKYVLPKNKDVNNEEVTEFSGNSFVDMVKNFSEAPTSQSDGDLGWVSSSQIDKDVLKKLKNSPIGYISEPIYLNSKKMERRGYVIYQLRGRRIINNLNDEQLNEVKISLMNRKLDAEVARYLAKLKSDNYIQIYEGNIR